MKPTGAQFLAACRSFEGEAYEQGPRRTDPTSNYKDCSGDVVAGLSKVGVSGVPTVSSTQAQWCYANGGEIPIDVALDTHGALLFMGADRGLQGFGNDGHVAISAGDGVNFTEARGHAYGVLFDTGAGRNWSGAGLIPALDYGPGHPTIPTVPTSPAPGRELALRTPFMRGDDVIEVQTRLYFWAYVSKDGALDPGAHDGVYGPKTQAAVMEFQRRNPPLAVDGIVGPATLTKLFAV